MRPKGFTLIELLLILAIFGIFIAIVVVFGRSAIIKSRNSNIALNVAEIKKVAQRIYLESPNGFEDLCAEGNSLNLVNPDLATLQRDIEDLGGSIRQCKASKASYCITANLVGERGFLCIDDEGKFSFLLPPDPEPCINDTATCP
ncbi:MAG: prepilin-type N-terminal cleavage/methylation domain-containing protein [Candidatus Pacebacteria bacterium]|nr:prepilin-type N-terminal cleavage/methylation domain-containing protein [Candidatus Paceibacterota bacterium]